MLHSALITSDREWRRQLAVVLRHALLPGDPDNGYTESEIIELIAAMCDGQPSLCLDQYLS